MSTVEEQANQEPEGEKDLKANDSNEKQKENAENSDGDGDGVERRSKDRPWGDADKNDDEVLSPEEREALSGDVEELTDKAGVMTYDFYSPAHINKSSLPALAIISEKIIESISEDLTNLLQREIEVTANDIEINRYGDFIHSLPTLTDTNIINVSKIDAQALVCIDGALIEIVMDSYFGGEGKLGDINEKQTFTGTEISLSNKILEMFLLANKNATPMGIPQPVAKSLAVPNGTTPTATGGSVQACMSPFTTSLIVPSPPAAMTTSTSSRNASSASRPASLPSQVTRTSRWWPCSRS